MRKRNFAITLSIVVIAIAGCGGGRVESAVLTGQRTDLKALVGYNADGVSVGAVATWDRSSGVDSTERPNAFGLYIGAETTWELTATDTPSSAPYPIDMLDGLTAVPYGRVEFLDNRANDNFGNLETVGVAGTRFELGESGDVSILVEYSTDGPNGPDTFIGPFFLF
jgi:hypothetical protein